MTPTVVASPAGPAVASPAGPDTVTGRVTLYLLLTVVAGAAAMLSFAALRDLAQLCGFTPALAWLLPVVVDAGAAAGSLVWLRAGTGESAQRFARRLALALLGLSVAANALGHGLAAYGLAPPWWVVVILSGIAPAVLAGMVHLAVLVGRPPQPTTQRAALDEAAPGARQDEQGGPAMAVDGYGSPWLATSAPSAAPWPATDWPPTDWPPAQWEPTDWTPPAEPATEPVQVEPVQVEPVQVEPVQVEPVQVQPARQDAVVRDPDTTQDHPDAQADDAQDADAQGGDAERAAVLIAAGAGRRRLSRELGVTEYEARRLLEQARPAPTDVPGRVDRNDDHDDDQALDARAAMADAPITTPTTTGARS